MPNRIWAAQSARIERFEHSQHRILLVTLAKSLERTFSQQRLRVRADPIERELE